MCDLTKLIYTNINILRAICGVAIVTHPFDIKSWPQGLENCIKIQTWHTWILGSLLAYRPQIKQSHTKVNPEVKTFRNLAPPPNSLFLLSTQITPNSPKWYTYFHSFISFISYFIYLLKIVLLTSHEFHCTKQPLKQEVCGCRYLNSRPPF